MPVEQDTLVTGVVTALFDIYASVLQRLAVGVTKLTDT